MTRAQNKESRRRARAKRFTARIARPATKGRLRGHPSARSDRADDSQVDIRLALTSGNMKQQAATLTPAEIDAVLANYLEDCAGKPARAD